MKRQIAFVVALALGLLAMAALTQGMIGWAQGEDPAAAWASSADIPERIEIASPPDRPAGVRAEDLEISALFNASLRVAGSALKPRSSDIEWRSGSEGGCLYGYSGNASAILNTPVYLPQGATIKFLRMYYNDTSATFNSVAWLTVYDLYGEVEQEFPVTSSGSAGPDFGDSGEFTHTVNYESFSYVINWRPVELGTEMQLCGFRIYYRTPPGYSYLPLVSKEE